MTKKKSPPKLKNLTSEDDGIDYDHVHRIVGHKLSCTKGIDNCLSAQKRQQELDKEHG